MTTFYIKNTNEKDLDLVTALNLAKPFDIIKLAEGDYFSDNKPYYFNLKKSVNIIGDSSNNRAIKLHAYFLIGDDVRITQVIMNLLTNAVKCGIMADVKGFLRLLKF